MESVGKDTVICVYNGLLLFMIAQLSGVLASDWSIALIYGQIHLYNKQFEISRWYFCSTHNKSNIFYLIVVKVETYNCYYFYMI